MHAKSAHPSSLKKSILYSKALRIKCICSTFEEYRKHFQDLIKRFIEKGYNESTIRKQIERVVHLERSLLLKNSKPKSKDSILFFVTYNSVLPNVKEIINKHLHNLNLDSSFKEIFGTHDSFPQKHKLETTYRNKHNTKQSNISNTYINNNRRSMYPMLHHSIALPSVLKTKTFTSAQTRKTFTIFHQVTCHSNYVMYLLECIMCKMQYFEKSETSFNIRLNYHKKDIKKPNAIEAIKHFNNNEHTFSKHDKFIIIEQLRNMNTTPTKTLKFRLKARENF